MSRVLGIGFDLVTVSEFAEQLDRAGTQMTSLFSPTERRDAVSKTTDQARHFAARWAAKEAVIKAWSSARFAQQPLMTEISHREIEVVTDAWGRPSIRLSGEIAGHLPNVNIHISLTHDGDVAGAFAVLEAD